MFRVLIELFLKFIDLKFYCFQIMYLIYFELFALYNKNILYANYYLLFYFC